MSFFKLERFLSIFTTIIIILTVYCDCYDYKNQKNWHQKYLNCGGEMQSPINIVISNTITFPLLPKLKLHNFQKNLSKPINLRNSGHTVFITTNNKCKKKEIPAIEGGNLPFGKFNFHQIHFHWGQNNENGSEHTINGKSYALELHIVFINEKYNNSLKKATIHPDGIAVIAILFKAMHFPSCNNKMESLLQNLYLIEKAKSDTNIDDINITLLDFIGQININKYFSYQGSLTSPPCSGPVNWIIFKDILFISRFTLKQFRKLYNTHAELILYNYRDIQHIGDRKVYYRYYKY